MNKCYGNSFKGKLLIANLNKPKNNRNTKKNTQRHKNGRKYTFYAEMGFYLITKIFNDLN